MTEQQISESEIRKSIYRSIDTDPEFLEGLNNLFYRSYMSVKDELPNKEGAAYTMFIEGIIAGQAFLQIKDESGANEE